MEKWGSRKLIITGVVLLVLCVLPIVYQKLGVPEAVQLLVIGAIAGASGVYNVANAYAKKWGQS